MFAAALWAALAAVGAGLLVWCAPLRDKVWNFGNASYGVSGWLILLLCTGPVILLVWFIGFLCRIFRPSYRRRYRTDNFDGVLWEWDYDGKGKILDLQPFCEVCRTRLMLTVTEQAFVKGGEAKLIPVTAAFCTGCNTTKGYSNVQNLHDHAERKIEQKIKTGRWNEKLRGVAGA